MMHLGVALFGFISFGTLSFFRFGMLSVIISSNTFLKPLLFLFSCWGPYNVDVSMHDVDSEAI